MEFTKNHRFSFKKLRESLVVKCEPSALPSPPNHAFLKEIIGQRKSQTLYDIWSGLGWSSLSSAHGAEIGKLINFYLPKREFTKVMNAQNREVRLYMWYEVPFIITLIFTYFGAFEYIPKHWEYAFYLKTDLRYILYHMNQNPELRNQLTCLSDLGDLEERITRDFGDEINAKYGIAVELYILDYVALYKK